MTTLSEFGINGRRFAIAHQTDPWETIVSHARNEMANQGYAVEEIIAWVQGAAAEFPTRRNHSVVQVRGR